MIVDYLNPALVFKSLKEGLDDLASFSRYRKIIFELEAAGKLTALGLYHDDDGNLYLGVNLNPELLLYSDSDTSQETVELKLIGEKMNKYNDFLTKEGILDAVTVDYDRVKDGEYYGYVLQIKYNFKKYRRSKFVYDICYFLAIASLIVGGIFIIL
jgi:hypothetical protein